MDQRVLLTFVLGKAVAAVDGTLATGPERHLGGVAAVGAGGVVHFTGAAVVALLFKTV